MLERSSKERTKDLLEKMSQLIDKGMDAHNSPDRPAPSHFALSNFIQSYIKLIELSREMELEETNQIDIHEVIMLAPEPLRLQFQEIWGLLLDNYHNVKAQQAAPPPAIESADQDLLAIEQDPDAL